MKPKTVYAIILLLIVSASLAVYGLASTKKTLELPTDCKSFDGFCNPGCTFENDADCPRQEVVQPGAISSCIADSDCAVARAICGNEGCVYIDNECRRGTICYVSINKNYELVWQSNGVNCVGEEIALSCPEPSALAPKCIRGTCFV